MVNIHAHQHKLFCTNLLKERFHSHGISGALGLGTGPPLLHHRHPYPFLIPVNPSPNQLYTAEHELTYDAFADSANMYIPFLIQRNISL